MQSRPWLNFIKLSASFRPFILMHSILLMVVLTSLKLVLIKFYQHVDSVTRGNNKLVQLLHIGSWSLITWLLWMPTYRPRVRVSRVSSTKVHQRVASVSYSSTTRPLWMHTVEHFLRILLHLRTPPNLEEYTGVVMRLITKCIDDVTG